MADCLWCRADRTEHLLYAVGRHDLPPCAYSKQTLSTRCIQQALIQYLFVVGMQNTHGIGKAGTRHLLYTASLPRTLLVSRKHVLCSHSIQQACEVCVVHTRQVLLDSKPAPSLPGAERPQRAPSRMPGVPAGQARRSK